MTALIEAQKPGEIVAASEFDIARQKLRADYLQVLEAGRKVKVTDEESSRTAAQLGKLLQASSKELDSLYKPHKQAIDKIKKAVLDMEKTDTNEIDVVKKDLAAQLLRYDEEQERIRQEQERLERAAALAAQEEARIQEALLLEQQGRLDEATQLLDEEPLSPPAIITAKGKSSSGAVRRESWKATVDNLMLLVKAVAAGKVPLLAVTADEGYLNRQATDYREGLNYPGVSVKREVSGHFRA